MIPRPRERGSLTRLAPGRAALAAAAVLSAAAADARAQVSGIVGKGLSKEASTLYLNGSLDRSNEADTSIYTVDGKFDRWFERSRKGWWRPGVGLLGELSASTNPELTKNYIKGQVRPGVRVSPTGDLQFLLVAAPTWEQDKNNTRRNFYVEPALTFAAFPLSRGGATSVTIDTATHGITDRGRVGWMITPRVGAQLGRHDRVPDPDASPARLREDGVRRAFGSLDVALDLSAPLQRATHRIGRVVGRDWINVGLLVNEKYTAMRANTHDGGRTFYSNETRLHVLLTSSAGVMLSWDRGRNPPDFQRIRTFRVGLVYLE